MKYRKKPIVIDAFQWFAEMGEVGGVERDFSREGLSPRGSNILYYRIRTLEGGHQVSVGDWIITGVEGEKYPIKDGIFRETHERVD